jgi:hypothetical protein
MITQNNLVHLRLSPIMIEALTELSFITGMSKQEIIRLALAEFIEKRTEKNIFSKSLKENRINNPNTVL